MNKTWVKTDYVSKKHKDKIIQGKWYKIIDGSEYYDLGGSLITETGEEYYIHFKSSSLLDHKSWTVHEGDTPPTEEIKKGREYDW